MTLQYLFLRLIGYKTFDEMMKEMQQGRRAKISRREAERSVVLERASFSKNIRYPLEGEVYLCIRDAPVSYMTYWMKPFTGGDRATFPKDEKIKISRIGRPKPTLVYCMPLNADKIEHLFVPESDREEPTYNGYSVVVETPILNKYFQLVQSGE